MALSRRLVVVAAVALLGGAAAAGPAYADAPSTQGWWTVAGGSAVPVPSAPDVPSGGLLVSSDGSPASPFSYAALSFAAAPGAGAAATLTLDLAANSASTPGSSLELCPLKSPTFTAADGGPISAAPQYDCTKNVTTGISSDGKTFDFDLASLLDGGRVAVAVLPVGALERVVLSKPDSGALAVQSAPAATAPTSPGDDPGAASASGPVAPGAGADPGASDTSGALSSAYAAAPSPADAATGDPSGAAATPSMAPAPSGAGSSSAGSASQSSAASSPAASGSMRPVAIGATSPSGSGSAAPIVAAVGVAGLLLAGLLWGYAGSSSGARREDAPSAL